MDKQELIAHKSKLVRLYMYYDLTEKQLTDVMRKISDINNELKSTKNKGK